MSVNHASMTTHPAQSLPSFAQAFSNQSLSSISSANNALPPIQAHISSMSDTPRHQRSPPTPSLSRPSSEEKVDSRTAGRKRPRSGGLSGSREDEPAESGRGSPVPIRVKEEQDQDMLDPSPSPPDKPIDHRPPQDAQGAPPPSSLMPSPMKRRRMTVTGAPHALNIDVRVPPDQTNSTPISPVVMGFTIHRDNPKEIEQLKSMMTVKQKQKALIEQRRGSVAGTAAGNPAPPPSTTNEDRGSSNAKTPIAPVPIRTARRSPTGGAGTRRIATSVPSQNIGGQRPASPNTSVFQMQQTQHLPHQSAQTLPPPPISFARRRAAQLGSKRKPADIVISPRELQTPEQVQPSIHSAPPTQGAFYSGRHPMTLPRLPNVMGSGDNNVRRPAGNVPPTPTRLSQHLSNSTVPPSITISGTTPRSPVASVPIASSLVPPTPAFNQTDFAGDKAAFLAPFSYFFDALNDAKQMKAWLGEQLQRSNSLFQSLSQHQDKLNETVDSIVERKLASVHSEMNALRRRVLELEDALRDTTSGRRPSVDVPTLYHSKNLQNGYSSSSTGHLAPDSYTFPPPPPDHSRLRSDLSSGRVSSPRERGDMRGQHEMEHESPVPFDARRSSVSASRLDPPRSHAHDGPSLPPPAPPVHSRISHSMQSPPQVYRDSPASHSLQPPPPSGHGKTRGGQPEWERPSLSRQASSHGGSQDREREREREHGQSPIPRRAGSRRNSIIMSPPDNRMEDS